MCCSLPVKVDCFLRRASLGCCLGGFWHHTSNQIQCDFAWCHKPMQSTYFCVCVIVPFLRDVSASSTHSQFHIIGRAHAIFFLLLNYIFKNNIFFLIEVIFIQLEETRTIYKSTDNKPK